MKAWLIKIGALTSIVTQLFDHCLAPDTTGDGTGCDNMTAVIVQFKKEGESGEAKKVNGDTLVEAEQKPTDGDAKEEAQQQQSSKRKESSGEEGEKAAAEASEGDPPSKKPKL